MHLLWVMLKVFRVDKDSETLFQLALVEREIVEMIETRNRQTLSKQVDNIGTSVETVEKHSQAGGICRREIEEGDVCPICQDDLTSSQPTLHCSKSCGNNIHSKCLKVLLDHHVKTLGADVVKCPFCRVDFASAEELKQMIGDTEKVRKERKKEKTRHFGSTCLECSLSPITGDIYRCIVCKV